MFCAALTSRWRLRHALTSRLMYMRRSSERLMPFSSHADWYALQSSSETRTTRFGMGSRAAMAKGYLICPHAVDMPTLSTVTNRWHIAYAFYHHAR